MFEKSSYDLLDEENIIGCRIKTLIKSFDYLLEGGIPSGIITEFCGGPGSGKTLLCLQMCLNSQLMDDIEDRGKAVFIDTNQGFNPMKLEEMATCRKKYLLKKDIIITEDELLSNIEYAYCDTIEVLRNAITIIKSDLENGINIKLIIIDSFSFIFRILNGTLGLRTKIIYEILTELQILANKYEVVVIVTNELTTKILENNETTVYPALGEAYAHKIGQSILFEKGFDKRRIYLHKTLYAPSVLIPFVIDDHGIWDTDTISGNT